MHIQRLRCGLHRRHAVVVVLRMKALDMTDRRNRPAHVEPMLAPAHGIIIGHRPAIPPRHQRHPVRAQHMQLQRQPVITGHGLDIAISRQQEMAVKRLEQLRPPLRRVGPGDQVQQRMHLITPVGVLQYQRQGRRRLGNQLHRAKAYRIAGKTRLGQRHRIARAPGHPARALPGHNPPRGAGLGLARALRLVVPPQKIKHRVPCSFIALRAWRGLLRGRIRPGWHRRVVFGIQRSRAISSCPANARRRLPGLTRPLCYEKVKPA